MNHSTAAAAPGELASKFFRAGRIAALCLLATLVGSASSAQAAQMSHLGGAFQNITQPGGSGGLNLVGGLPITPGLAGSLLTGAVVGDLQVDLTGYTGVVNGPSGPITLGDLVITSGADQAVFNLTNARLNQHLIVLPVGSFGIGFITADAVLDTAQTTPNAWDAELDPFTLGGSLVITYNGALVTSNGVNGSATLSFTPTASFTLTAIPEPSAVALACSGLGALFGVMWYRQGTTRRRQGGVSRNQAG